jgi:hypothetical protein
VEGLGNASSGLKQWMGGGEKGCSAHSQAYYSAGTMYVNLTVTGVYFLGAT